MIERNQLLNVNIFFLVQLSGSVSIDEDNSDIPSRYHRRPLLEDEVAFINSGGASKFDPIPKKDAKSKKGGPVNKKK